MTELPIADIHQLVQEGRAAALAGDTLAARSSFRRATEADPTSVEAWVGLSSVVPILAEKREYLRKALDLDPQNADAAASLRYVEQLIAKGMQLEPSRRRDERNASGDASPLLGAPEPAAATAVEFCYRHPDRETGLHCTQCGRPICAECATMTSVGQLCPDDRRARRPSNYKVSAGDVIVGGLVALLASAAVALLLSLFVGRLGFFGIFIIVMVGPAIAEFIVRVVDRVTKLKRGRPMQITIGVAIALGTLPFALFGGLLLLLYMVLAISTAVARLR
ncbi:MAG TPA: hypothetical protein PLO33_14805 [Kouleothrix sp.]|uniref:hypothetical protein n=1 Tax=Kouleothrix sp. TaxID=2779161 RepID=UPI002BED7566|nr:hypothetical protein [Kouleothrix sp.]HRC76946.1 hypothetical protein [Kouleothrix sp.]